MHSTSWGPWHSCTSTCASAHVYTAQTQMHAQVHLFKYLNAHYHPHNVTDHPAAANGTAGRNMRFQGCCTYRLASSFSICHNRGLYINNLRDKQRAREGGAGEMGENRGGTGWAEPGSHAGGPLDALHSLIANLKLDQPS